MDSFLDLSADAIFATVQGEGFSQGKKVVFIRTAFCPLSCHFCLSGNSLITVPLGGRVPLRDLKVGDKVVSLNSSSGSLEEDEVLEVFSREIPAEDLTLIKLGGGRKLYASKDHPFFVSNKGWVQAGDLSRGDDLYFLSQRQFGSWKMKQYPVILVTKEKNPTAYDRVRKASSDRWKANPPIHNPEHAKKVRTPENLRKLQEAAVISSRKPENRLASSKRLKDNPPMRNPEILQRMLETSCSYKKQSAPEKRVGRIIEQMKLPIRYCGNGTYFVHSGTTVLVPDFKVKGKKEVIEVYDSSYNYYEEGLRTATWEDKRRKDLVGHKVLFIDTTTSSDSQIREKLLQFVMNGVKVESCSLVKNKTSYLGFSQDKKTVTVFNIRTRNGNFFANGVLSHNCDTAYTWAHSEKRVKLVEDRLATTLLEKNPLLKVWNQSEEVISRSVESIFDEVQIKATDHAKHIVLSGGEPLMWYKKLVPLLKVLKGEGFYIEVETAGIIIPDSEFDACVDHYNVSPKLANSLNPESEREKPTVLKWFAAKKNAYFKFVIDTDKDLTEVQYLVSRYQINPDNIYIMPQAQTKEVLLSKLPMIKKIAEEEGWKATTRMHIELWGEKRGV